MPYIKTETFECDTCGSAGEPVDYDIEGVDTDTMPLAAVGWVVGNLKRVRANPEFDRLTTERNQLIEAQMPEIVNGLKEQLKRDPTPDELIQAKEMVGQQIAAVEEDPFVLDELTLALCPLHAAEKLKGLGITLEG